MLHLRHALGSYTAACLGANSTSCAADDGHGCVADPTFSYSSQENGISRLYNGVHFSK